MTAAADVLRERARKLAQPLVQPQEQAHETGLVLALPGGRRYVVPAALVLQVLRNDGLRRLPSGCGDLLGLVLARSGPVPVADLATLLDLSPADSNRGVVVVLDGQGADPLGLLVDEAVDLVEVPAGSPGAPEVTADGSVLLDPAALLSDPRLRVSRSELPDQREEV